MRRFAEIILISLALAGVSAQRAATSQPTTQLSDGPPRVSEVARKYSHLTLLTPKPADVDPVLAELCRGASQVDVDAAKKKSGPHAYTAVTIYMNSAAADAFAHSATPYPRRVGHREGEKTALLSLRSRPKSVNPTA
jgi:hypothetical protein